MMELSERLVMVDVSNHCDEVLIVFRTLSSVMHCSSNIIFNFSITYCGTGIDAEER